MDLLFLVLVHIALLRDVPEGGAGGLAFWRGFVLAKSAAVPVVVLKNGGEFFHHIGSTSGRATRGSLPGLLGNTTPNLGMSPGARLTRSNPSEMLSFNM